MEDKTLFIISLIVSFVGIILLLFVYQYATLEITNLNLINDKRLGDYVNLTGEINSVKSSEGMYIIQIGDGNVSVSVVVFTIDKLTFRKGDFILVEGKIDEYKKKKEIIASKIVVL